jgi:hypothetical protein
MHRARLHLESTSALSHAVTRRKYRGSDSVGESDEGQPLLAVGEPRVAPSLRGIGFQMSVEERTHSPLPEVFDEMVSAAITSVTCVRFRHGSFAGAASERVARFDCRHVSRSQRPVPRLLAHHWRLNEMVSEDWNLSDCCVVSAAFLASVEGRCLVPSKPPAQDHPTSRTAGDA